MNHVKKDKTKFKKVHVYIIASPIGDYLDDFSYSAVKILKGLEFIFS